MNETWKTTAEPLTESGLFHSGSWTLYGPTRSETLHASKADLAIFRLTGEWPSSVLPVAEGFIVRTPSQWVFATLNGPSPS